MANISSVPAGKADCGVASAASAKRRVLKPDNGSFIAEGELTAGRLRVGMAVGRDVGTGLAVGAGGDVGRGVYTSGPTVASPPMTAVGDVTWAVGRVIVISLQDEKSNVKISQYPKYLTAKLFGFSSFLSMLQLTQYCVSEDRRHTAPSCHLAMVYNRCATSGQLLRLYLFYPCPVVQRIQLVACPNFSIIHTAVNDEIMVLSRRFLFIRRFH